MDGTSKKLIGLLESGDIELRMSAIRIICEIGLDSKPVVHSLARSLREESEPLRILALRALARLGARDVLELVVPMVLESGALRENAMAVIAAAGSPAVPHLCSLYGKADFHGKLSVATTLARIGGKPSVECLLEVLPGEPFEIQKHITRCVSDALDAMTPVAQAPLLKPVLKLLARKRPEDVQVIVAALIILGYFHGEKLVKTVRKALLEFAAKGHPGEMRRHALVSYGRLLGEGNPGPEGIATLEKLLCDEDWNNVAQHALSAIQRIELPKAQLLKLTSLLHRSPHFSVHIYLFDKLRGHDAREVARAIIPFLRDSRFRVRDAAEAALRSIPSAIEDLFDALLEEDDLEVRQRMALILREYPQEAKRQFAETATRLFMSLFDQNDPRHQIFFDFAQALDPEPIRQKIYQKVRTLKAGRSQEKWIKIAGYLQILWDHHLITPDGRYLFAVALIHQSTKDLSPPARRSNLGLRVIRALIYDNTPGLVEALLKDRDIGPDEMFYIGFHFLEEGEEMRPFARAILEHLVKKYPKSKLSAAARAKLELHVEPPPAPVSAKGKGKGKAKAREKAMAETPATKAPAEIPAREKPEAPRKTAPQGKAPPPRKLPPETATKTGGKHSSAKKKASRR